MEVTPVFVTVTAPEVAFTLMPVPAASEVTHVVEPTTCEAFVLRHGAEASVALRMRLALNVEVAWKVAVEVTFKVPPIKTLPVSVDVPTTTSVLVAFRLFTDTVLGSVSVTAPVEAETAIWFAVPASEVTPVFAIVMLFGFVEVTTEMAVPPTMLNVEDVMPLIVIEELAPPVAAVIVIEGAELVVIVMFEPAVI